MSRSLGIETVAEGIETSEQADRMRALGCAYGQGYVFAAPLSADELLTTFGSTAVNIDGPAKVEVRPDAPTSKRAVAPRVPRLAPGTTVSAQA